MGDGHWPHLKGVAGAGARPYLWRAASRQQAQPVVCPAQRQLALLGQPPPHTMSTAPLTLGASRDPVLYFHLLIRRSRSILFVLATGSPLLGAAHIRLA